MKELKCERCDAVYVTSNGKTPSLMVCFCGSTKFSELVIQEA